MILLVDGKMCHVMHVCVDCHVTCWLACHVLAVMSRVGCHATCWLACTALYVLLWLPWRFPFRSVSVNACSPSFGRKFNFYIVSPCFYPT